MISAPWMEGKPGAWLRYRESTWKIQRGASLASCRANSCVWHVHCCWEKWALISPCSTAGFVWTERWEPPLGMVGARRGHWLHSPFKTFTSVPLVAQLLIILLALPLPTLVRRAQAEIFFLPLQCQDRLLCFFFPLNILISETPHNYPLFKP